MLKRKPTLPLKVRVLFFIISLHSDVRICFRLIIIIYAQPSQCIGSHSDMVAVILLVHFFTRRFKFSLVQILNDCVRSAFTLPMQPSRKSIFEESGPTWAQVQFLENFVCRAFVPRKIRFSKGSFLEKIFSRGYSFSIIYMLDNPKSQRFMISIIPILNGKFSQ